jgi:hypothetical protein
MIYVCVFLDIWCKFRGMYVLNLGLRCAMKWLSILRRIIHLSLASVAYYMTVLLIYANTAPFLTRMNPTTYQRPKSQQSLINGL